MKTSFDCPVLITGKVQFENLQIWHSVSPGEVIAVRSQEGQDPRIAVWQHHLPELVIRVARSKAREKKADWNCFLESWFKVQNLNRWLSNFFGDSEQFDLFWLTLQRLGAMSRCHQTCHPAAAAQLQGTAVAAPEGVAPPQVRRQQLGAGPQMRSNSTGKTKGQSLNRTENRKICRSLQWFILYRSIWIKSLDLFGFPNLPSKVKLQFNPLTMIYCGAACLF